MTIPSRSWPTHEELDNARWHERATRRHVMKVGAGTAVIAATGGVAARVVTAQDYDYPASSSTPPSFCQLTPEFTDGPYYLDDLLVRNDITEGKAGVPLTLRITVVDATTCAPVENAAVDIWHCDALGFYSGFVDADPGGGGPYVDDGSDPNTFLRGVLLSDANGVVEFQTLYPGWYGGRAIHIHMKVHTGGATEDGTYDGGTTAHTGQIAFADAFSDQIFGFEPYASRTSDYTRSADDGIFGDIEDDDPTFFVALKAIDENDLSQGVTGEIAIGVDSGA